MYACGCRCCRKPSTISLEYSECPYMATVGTYEQQTIHGAVAIAKQRKVQLMKNEVFAQQIKRDSLYAAR